MNRLPVAVVGGGVAGISAAFHLSRYDIPTILFEHTDRLGGRVCSFYDSDFDSELDLGVHIVAGAYREFLALLRGFGTDDDLHWLRPLHIPFKGVGTPVYNLRFWRLPGILGPLGGLLSFDALPFRQRLGLAAQFARLVSMKNVPAISAEAWLTNIGVTPAQMSRFWQPLALATLNALPQQISIIELWQIAKLGCSAHHGFALGVPTKPWQQIVGNAALDYFKQHGIEVRLKAKITGIVTDGNRAKGLFVNGERKEVAAVILAVSPWDWKRILTPQQFELLLDKAWLSPPEAAIHGVHFLFDKPPTTARMLGLFGTTNQWVFARRMQNSHWLVSTVISGSSDLLQYPADKVISLTLKELRSVWAGFSGEPLKARCIRVRRGTCPFSSDLENRRPGQKTGIPGLFFANDSTATGLAGTLESATRAGFRAVEARQADLVENLL